MTTAYWLLALGAAALFGCILKRAGRTDDAVSQSWIDEQIRERGWRQQA